MTKSSYRELDYAFGQRMLALRMAIGLTQASLAELLGVSRHAVGAWETGESYPKAGHLKHLITLCLQQRAFTAGREAEEIRDLWRAAHQKVLLDERWLQAILPQLSPAAAPMPVDHAAPGDRSTPSPAALAPRVDWGDALDVPALHGRTAELALLARWVVDEHCRVVSVLGMGGVGKSALAVSIMRQVAPNFAMVIWRSLRDAPTCDALVADCLLALAPHLLHDLPDALDARLGRLMEQLRDRRVLLVLDNLETVLEDGTGTGQMRAGFEGYARLVRRVGETAHQSCLLLTSREQLAELAPLEGKRAPVRALRLAGLDASAGAQLLEDYDVAGTPDDQARLVVLYGGNPLALKIVAQSIAEIFGGEIAPFLEQGEVVFGGVRELLDEQVDRLTGIEQRVFFWLAILREPAGLEELLPVLSEPLSAGQALEALDGLRRRSLIERGQQAGSFTLQSVVLEYATARLITEASHEIVQGRLERLIQYNLCQATAKDYVRQVQERLIVVPLLSHVRDTYPGQADIEARFHWLLDRLRDLDYTSQGYGPANLVALLRVLRGNLRHLNLARLALRGVSLQGIEMQDATLSAVMIQESAFTETFDAVTAVAVSSAGTYWASASREGDIRVWNAGSQTLWRVWRAHADLFYGLTFSPDGARLASGSWDGTVKLWDFATDNLAWSGKHAGHVNSVTFSPDGSRLASCGDDGIIRIWDVEHGALIQSIAYGDLVISLVWSPDGRHLAASDVAGHIRLWQVHSDQAPTYAHTFIGHGGWVDGLAFSPDSAMLASAGNDSTVKLWDVADGRLRQIFTGHTSRVTRVAWSPDGRILASSSLDQTIRLWDVEQLRFRTALHGHTAVVVGVAFLPDSRGLLSGSGDGSLRVWDTVGGQCVRVLQGYATSLYDVDWSPHNTHLVSGGSDTLVTIFDVTGATPATVLGGHNGVVYGVGWSANGRWLASSELDNAIRLWDQMSGDCLQVLRDPDDPGNFFYGLAWSPDGLRLAAGTYRHGVQVFELTTQRQPWAGHAFPTWIRSVAWSPDGALIAGGGDDGTVYVWDAEAGTLLQRLVGHGAKVTSVAWSMDGKRLASGSSGLDGGELFAWSVPLGERLQTFKGHPGVVASVAWSPDEDVLLSGDSEGMLRWWDVGSGQCVRAHAAHHGTVHALQVSRDHGRVASCGDDGAIQILDLSSGAQLQTLRRDRPYERMDITGLTGITPAQRASLLSLGAVEKGWEGQPQTGENVRAVPIQSVPALDGRRPTSDPNLARGMPFQPTSFVGRSAELREIAQLLSNPACRLVTLLGPGGIGKSRLAREVAAGQSAAFTDGIAFVTLASVGTPQQVVSAIGDTLGLSFVGQTDPTAQLLDSLRKLHMLLVLDTFEHLLAGADLIAAILAGAPHVAILITSRERLNLQAEWLYDVDGLTYPVDETNGTVPPQDMPEATSYGAVELFVQRAMQIQPAFHLTGSTLATIVRICQHVAGMPLAIELAAAGVRSLPVGAIEQRIRANLDLLATNHRDVPARHHSLRAVFDHSWSLLGESERLLLPRLAIFRGGWTAAAAEQVAGATLPAIAGLVDKSLVRRNGAEPGPITRRVGLSGAAEPRFALLEAIREYALEQLAARDEAAAVRQAHASYYTTLAEAAAAAWGTATVGATIVLLDREHDNIRAALQWACDHHDSRLGLRLADALWQFWRSYGYASEGRAWLEQLLALEGHPNDPVGMAARQRGLQAAAWLASDQHQYEQAARLFSAAKALSRALGETEDDTDLFLNAARRARDEGRYQRAATLLEQALATHRGQGHDVARGSVGTDPALYAFGQALREMGLVAREQGDFVRAQALFEESLAFHRVVGDRSCVAFALIGLADVARDQGHADQVRMFGEEALAMLRELGMPWAIGFTLNTLALGAMYEGNLTRALALIRQSEAIFRGLEADASLTEVLITLGKIMRAQGDIAAAYAAISEALRLAQTAGPRLFVPASLEGLAGVLAVQGQAEQSVRFLAAAAALRQAMGTPIWPADQATVREALATTRSNLGDKAFAVAWAAAGTHPPDDILRALTQAGSLRQIMS